MIKQPNAIFGNDNMLVTMGKNGELFGFFYPRRDYAQHVEDSLACIHIDNKLLWLNTIEWNSKQNYIPDTNIIITELSHQKGIRIKIEDIAHTNAAVIIRKYIISADQHINGTFFYYSNFNLGEMQKKNSAFCDTDANILIQYWRDNYIGIMSNPPFEDWQIGKAMDTIWWTNSRYDMEDGILQKNKEDIGYLNSVLGWNLNLKPGEKKEIIVYIAASKKRRLLYEIMMEIIREPIENIIETNKNNSIKWLSKKNILNLSILDSKPELKNKIHQYMSRSLLVLDLLHEPTYGSFIAAPEFDHDFELSGGYGYCWNRDACESVIALLHAGYPEYCDKFLKWCAATQLPDGSWFQRYWLDGNTAPSWGNFAYSTQIDETGSTLNTIYTYYLTLNGLKKVEFLEKIWISVLIGAEYLMKRSSDGLHEPCLDIWESHIGIFSYTSASTYAGLKSAAYIAEAYDEPQLAKRWQDQAEIIKKSTIEQLWSKERGYFAKCITDESCDFTVDASIIGVFTPFNMLTPEDPDERNMIYSMLNIIENKLSVSINGYKGIKRYEDDRYIGGNPWIVTTLWLSKAWLLIAEVLKKENKKEEVVLLTEKAIKYIEWAIKGSTSAGLLPEQVDRNRGHPAWAIPLGWSCALMIENILILNRLSEDK